MGVAGEQLSFGDRVKLIYSHNSSATHGDGECPVDIDNSGRRYLTERIVQRDDFCPVCICVAPRLCMAGGNTSLDVKTRELLTSRGALEEREAFGDKGFIPKRSILLMEQKETSIICSTGWGPASMEAKQRLEGLRVRRGLPVVISQQTGKSKGFVAEGVVYASLALRGRVALGKELVEHVKDRAKAQ